MPLKSLQTNANVPSSSATLPRLQRLTNTNISRNTNGQSGAEELPPNVILSEQLCQIWSKGQPVETDHAWYEKVS